MQSPPLVDTASGAPIIRSCSTGDQRTRLGYALGRCGCERYAVATVSIAAAPSPRAAVVRRNVRLLTAYEAFAGLMPFLAVWVVYLTDFRDLTLAQVGINSAVELFGTYSGSRTDMANWLEDAEINTDRNLRLQYLAGLGLNQYDAASIYRELIQETRYPEHLFEGSEETLAELRTFVDRALGVSRQGF